MSAESLEPYEALAALIERELQLVSERSFDELQTLKEVRTELQRSLPAADYAEAVSASLVQLALEILGVDDPRSRQAGRHVGIAYALAGLIRAIPFRTGIGRPVIPMEIAERHGIGRPPARTTRSAPGVRAATAEVAARPHDTSSKPGSSAEGCRAPRCRRSAGKIAQDWLMRLKRAEYDVFDPVLAAPDPLQGWRLTTAALFKRF